MQPGAYCRPCAVIDQCFQLTGRSAHRHKYGSSPLHPRLFRLISEQAAQGSLPTTQCMASRSLLRQQLTECGRRLDAAPQPCVFVPDVTGWVECPGPAACSAPAAGSNAAAQLRARVGAIINHRHANVTLCVTRRALETMPMLHCDASRIHYAHGTVHTPVLHRLTSSTERPAVGTATRRPSAHGWQHTRPATSQHLRRPPPHRPRSSYVEPPCLPASRAPPAAGTARLPLRLLGSVDPARAPCSRPAMDEILTTSQPHGRAPQ